jgi:hypothetical protein
MTEQAAPSGAVRFVHIPHPRIRERANEKPPKTDDERVGFNGRLGAKITAVVGTMWVAYLFTVLALISLPGAISTKDTVVIVAWVAQTFLQLVLLPIIIVGQNVQSSAADKRAIQTYKDAEAILHECLQLQSHLEAQDQVLDHLIGQVVGGDDSGAKASARA